MRRPNPVLASSRPVPAFPLRLLSCLLLLLAVPLVAQATDGRWALQVEPANLAELLARTDQLEWEVSPAGQIDWSLRIDPSLRYRVNVESETSEWTPRATLSAQLDFADNPATVLRRRQTLQRAYRTLDHAQVNAVRDALLAHSNLLIAREQEEAQARTLEASRSELVAAGLEPERVEGAYEAGGLPAVQEAFADADMELLLDHLGAYVDHRERLAALEAAQWEWLDLGFSGAPRYGGLRFALPDPSELAGEPLPLHELRLLELTVELLETELRLLGQGVLDDLRLRGAYRNRTGTVDLEGGLVNGLPGLNVGASTVGGPERWEVRLSGQLVFGDGLAGRGALEEELERARLALAEFVADADRVTRELHSRAVAAERSLGLAEAQVELLEREQRSLSTARVRMYRAWSSYVREAANYLRHVGGEWRLRE